MLPGPCVIKLFVPFFAAIAASGHSDGLMLAAAADSFGVPHEVMWAVANAETRHNASNRQRSVAGAQGRMQINPHVWRCNSWRYRDNLACGAAILYFYFRESGSWVEAPYLYHGRGPKGRAYARAVRAEAARLRARSMTP